MEGLIEIPIIRLIPAYAFILVLLLIVKQQEIGNEWEIVLANIRMTIQLIAIGYILTYIFANPSVVYSLLVLLVMQGFAIQNAYARVNNKISFSLKKIVAIAMFLGTSITIIYFIVIIINLQPWYQPQYFIPLSGMLIGNSMTGISLGIEGLINGMKDNQEMIENALMLGGKPELIIKDISGRAFYNAILPTINSMMGMGIVFLPGMMTGQILAGAMPLTAIKYQLAIMLGILASVTLTVYIMIKWGAKTFFNDRAQLKIES
ncbi:ABC transporter permease [Fuchsiella alkaliacetigena]|uniref:ABC transporter permease n=1 Tax=Fuchsiella alkaliacetigena TaxID=957042 RepID=UPI00200B9D0C|nr:iron export ABC transporter permease subunit FetB [Fuchsiella alkaliacetigena]MCK8825851.1 iron export ABC transporter permease subunit FetB [Fuchsiella alkaliacetigena]